MMSEPPQGKATVGEVEPEQHTEQLLAELLTDRREAKAKERRESWTRYTSVTVVVIAVGAAVANQWAGRYTTRLLAALNDATFHQVKASDEWNFYQAKSIKQTVAELGRDGAVEEKLVEGYLGKSGRYESEKAAIKASAERLETLREAAHQRAEVAQGKSNALNLCVSLYQIAIALVSICLVTKKKQLWFGGLAVATYATGNMVWAFLS
ncbi:MAG: DUF4337 family protein [Myxococcales bacterium]|nr:DUF4337 family protein [Myxococcales bacterium]